MILTKPCLVKRQASLGDLLRNVLQYVIGLSYFQPPALSDYTARREAATVDGPATRRLGQQCNEAVI